MATEPAVSVIMPVADVAPWVGQAVESVLAQEVELELIVAVDRSTDGTAELVRDAASRDSRLRVLDAGGVGGGEARNLAIAQARGRFLAFADGDDLVPSGAYAALLAQAERSGSPMVIGDHLSFWPTLAWRSAEANPALRARSRIRLGDAPGLVMERTVWDRIIARDEWERLGLRFSSSRRANDIAAMTAAYCALEFDVIVRPVYYYRWRVGQGSMTSQKQGRAEYADYIAEEASCAALVEEYGDAGVSQAYADFLLSRDIPGHLLPRLVALAEAGQEADPAEFAPTVQLARRVLAAAGRWPQQPAVVPLALAVGGRLPAARLVATALEGAGLLADPELTAGLPDALGADGALSPAVRQEAVRRVLEHQLELLVARRAGLEPSSAGAALAGLRALAGALPARSLDTRARALLSARASADPLAALDAAAATRAGRLPLTVRLPRALRARARWLLGKETVQI